MNRAFFLRFALLKFEQMARLRLFVFICLLLCRPAGQFDLRAQVTDDRLLEARAWQLRGRPDRAVAILEPMLADKRNESLHWMALRQYTAALASSGADSAAQSQAKAMLQLNPAFKPDQLNDPPAFADLFSRYSAVPATSFYQAAGIGLSHVQVIRSFRPADYTKNYRPAAAYSFSAGLSHRLSKNLGLETALMYQNSGFNHAYAIAEWNQIEIRERLDLLALPVALRLQTNTFNRRRYFLRAGVTPALTLDVRTDYTRTFSAAAVQSTAITGVRNTGRREAFQLAWHTGIGVQQESRHGRYGLQISANYWQTPWVNGAKRFDAPDLSYAYFHYDDDLRRLDFGLQFFTERTIQWQVKTRPAGPALSTPWRMWMAMPSALAGDQPDQRLEQCRSWLTRNEFQRVSDSSSAWLQSAKAQNPDLLRMQMLARHGLGDSIGTAQAISRLLEKQPAYLRFPGMDPVLLQAQYRRYRILHALEAGIQAGVLVPSLRIRAYHRTNPSYYHTFTPTAGYQIGVLFAHQFYPDWHVQGGMQLLGFGYTARLDNNNEWTQVYREQLQYAGIPVRLQWTVPKHSFGLVLAGSAGFLLKARSENVLTSAGGGISRNTLNNFADRKPFQWAYGGGVFKRIRAGDAAIRFECLWMQHAAIFNRPENRFQRMPQRIDYAYLDSDLQFATLQFNVAYAVPIIHRAYKAKSK